MNFRRLVLSVWAPFLITIAILAATFIWYWNVQIASNKEEILKFVDVTCSRDLAEGNYFKVAEALISIYDSDLIACASISDEKNALVQIPQSGLCSEYNTRFTKFLAALPFIRSPVPFVFKINEAQKIKINVTPRIHASLETSMLSLFSITLISLFGLLGSTWFYWFSIGKQNQLALIQKEEMVMMAKQISHDLRSPLAALKAAISVNLQEPLLVQKASQRIEEIINLLLKENVNSEKDKIPLLEVVESLVSEWQQSLETSHRNIELKLIAENWSASDLLVDSLKIFRLINNIIQNSVEAMPDHFQGKIEIILEAGTKKILEVKDNGPGLPSVVASNLFRKAITFGKSGGHGLGLLIIKKLADELNWEVKVKSGTSGTAFTFFKR